MHILVNGSEVFVYSGGKRFDPALPAVLLVHGAANDHSVWAQQSRYLAHHGYAVLAVDLPGHGRSQGPVLTSVEAHAAWLVAVLDALGARDAAIVGHSLGSLAALHAAASYPQRVRRIGLLGTAVPMPVSDQLLNAARDDREAAYRMIVVWSISFAQQMGGNSVPGMWLPGASLRLMQRCAPGVLHAALSACNEYRDGLAAAARVQCPALVLLGGRDLMAPPKAAQGLITALANKEVVILPEAGHALMGEDPGAVLDALRRFLAAV